MRPNGSDITRFGFVTGKAVGSAVVRNRVKRRLREAARSFEVAPGLDIVIGARAATPTASYVALRDALGALLRRVDGLRVSVPAADQR